MQPECVGAPATCTSSRARARLPDHQCELSNKVLEVKEIIAKQCDVPANQQRLIYSGKVLKDPETCLLYTSPSPRDS